MKQGARRRKLAPGEVERIVAWVHIEIAKRLRIYAARQRTSQSIVVEQALERYLKTRERG